MNWNVIEGNWAQYKRLVKTQWRDLNNDSLDAITGKCEQLSGQIQKSYGVTREEADRQIKNFQDYLKGSPAPDCS